jgi:hypothetical protein
MITFREHSDPSYVGRTKDNASAHATIAIASNFDSAGEKLTKRLVEEGKRTYIPVDINESLNLSDEIVEKIVKGLNTSLRGNLLDNEITLNIAGNGIYTLKGKYTQRELDDYVYNLLKKVNESSNLRARVIRLRTGGQTGLDEAGAKAGEKLGIPTLVVCPKGWKFRGLDGADVNDEALFKERFFNS